MCVCIYMQRGWVAVTCNGLNHDGRAQSTGPRARFKSQAEEQEFSVLYKKVPLRTLLAGKILR